MKLNIGKVECIESEKNVSLQSNISYGDESFVVKYEFDKKIKDYVVYDRADAFVVPLLPYAMLKARNDSQLEVVSETPISAELYHQLVNYYIPVLTHNISYYSNISLLRNTTNERIVSSGAVATGISGGVDSSYTVTKYACESEAEIKLTHGLFYNLGVYGGFDSEAEHNLEKRAAKICQEVGIQLVVVKNNIIDVLYKKCHGPIVPHVVMGGVLALQKLFSIYFMSAEVSAEEICFDDDYACFYDWLSTANYSTNCTKFYLSGIERKRLEKIKYIANQPFAQKYLSVCTQANDEKGNCSVCAKCTSAMVSLDAIGALDSFKEAFDVDYYYSNLGYYLSYVTMKKWGNDLWCKEIYDEYCKNHGSISLPIKIKAGKKWIARGFSSNNPNKSRVEDEII